MKASVFGICLLAIGGFPAPGAAAELPATIAKVKPSIVGIATHHPTRAQPVVLRGTGFVVGDGHHVVTNAHVVADVLDVANKEQYVAVSGRGRQGSWSALTAVAEDTKHDLALLKFAGRALPALTLDASTPVREGQRYAFTGFPIAPVLGLYPVTHRGIISAVTPIAIPMGQGRQLRPEHIKRLRQPFNVYQLDAVAYPGNSGSPLYAPDTGAVVGVLNSVLVKGTREDALSRPSGISYAIPIRYVNELLERVRR